MNKQIGIPSSYYSILNPNNNDRELLLNGVCEIIDNNPDITKAFETMRLGYPELPLEEQCSGLPFRDSSAIIMEEIAKTTLMKNTDRDCTILLPWRSGLAFGASYKAVGVNNFYHLSSRRNEKTLQPEVDYACGETKPDQTIIIADPMLATGGTIVDAISRLTTDFNIPPSQIIINAVVAAPEGIRNINQHYPDVKFTLGSLDKELDNRGYIVPGLGDFGDKYFAYMSMADLEAFVDQFDLPVEGREKILERFSQH